MLTATCADNCMACDTSTGACLPYSCKYGYYLDTTCKVATSHASTAIMTDGSDIMANCEGFNRIQSSGSDTCVTGTTTCDAACSDAGCVDDNQKEYCYGCRSAWPTDVTDFLVQNGSSVGYLWIRKTACTGNSSVNSDLALTCSQFLGTDYCSLCKDGYIARRTSTSSSTCISRSVNTALLDPAQLLYCIMIDDNNNCLSCDIFKDTTMVSNAACSVPALPGVIGRTTWPEDGTDDVWYYRQTSHTGLNLYPDVFIGSKFGAPPTSAQKTGKGGDIFVETTADSNSLESYSLASEFPYIYGTTTNSGVNYIYTFGYGYYVEESYISYRTPSHAFGALTTFSDNPSSNWACPANPATGTACSGNEVSGSTKCTSVSTAVPLQPNCECKSGFAGLACEETITKSYTNDFSYSSKSTNQYDKVIFATTSTDMKKYGFTDIRTTIPDYTTKSGGQDVMVLTRGQSVFGMYDKQNWVDNIWTGNSYLPGFQKKYWSGTDLGDEIRRLRILQGLGNETRRLRLRQLSSFYNSAAYTMMVGLNKNAFAAMTADKPLYFTIVRLFERDITISAETLVRGMPLALKIIIPLFSIGAIAICLLLVWCMMDTEGGKEDGENAASEKGSEQTEDNQNLIKKQNSGTKNSSNKVQNEVYPIGESKQKKAMEKTMNDDIDPNDQDRNPATQTMPLSNEPFIEKIEKNQASNNFIESDNDINQETANKNQQSGGDDEVKFGLKEKSNNEDNFDEL